MRIPALPLVLQLVAGFLCMYIIYRIYLRFQKYVSHQRFTQRHACEPAQALSSKYPFGFGIFMEDIKAIKAHVWLVNYQQRYSQLGCTTFTAQFLWLSFIFTIEPENIKSILATDFKSYSVGEERKKSLRPILGEGIFTTDGSAWQHSRDLLRPCFVRSQLGDTGLFEKHVRNLIRAIPRDGSTVDLQDLFYKLTLDVATEFLFGESTCTLDADKRRPEDERFAEAFSYVQNSIEGKSLLALFLPDRRFNESCKYIHNWVDALIELSLSKRPSTEKDDTNVSEGNRSKGRYLLLYELASQTSDKGRIRTELLNILLAGRDTTAALLSNVWWSISKNPRIWERLQKEVDSLETPLGEVKPAFEELKAMKYLRAVLNESLRVHPVVPANSRQAIVDTVLPNGGGKNGKSPVFVPKGTIVNYGVHAMHHRKELFGEYAEEFRPERWLDEDGKKGLRVGWEYLPFNGGPRICIGRECFGNGKIGFTLLTDIKSNSPSRKPRISPSDSSRNLVALKAEIRNLGRKR
ncbi:MAG: hypothetical protein Q9216_002832 [Gyalolechia sp. 2 TL-2023]